MPEPRVFEGELGYEQDEGPYLRNFIQFPHNGMPRISGALIYLCGQELDDWMGKRIRVTFELAGPEEPIKKEPPRDLRTLRDIIMEHPEWLDRPIGIIQADGNIVTVGDAGSVYMGWDDTVVFSPG